MFLLTHSPFSFFLQFLLILRMKKDEESILHVAQFQVSTGKRWINMTGIVRYSSVLPSFATCHLFSISCISFYIWRMYVTWKSHPPAPWFSDAVWEMKEDRSTMPLKSQEEKLKRKWSQGASLGVQWLRIHLPTQGTRVRAQVREDPTCRRATKPVCHNYWACVLEPTRHNSWAHAPQLLKPACHNEPVLPNKEKPLQWEAHAPRWRVAPARPT